MIQILSIQDEISKYFNDFESTSINNILSRLKKISNQNLFDFFKLQQRSLFLAYLCEIQSNDYRIIPTTEILLSNEKLISEDDTFLFTTKSKNGYFIIWESTMINRATYVFQTSEITYSIDIQKLFDFIASDHNRKRRKLRFSIKAKENPFNSIGAAEHKGFETWKAKLTNIINY